MSEASVRGYAASRTIFVGTRERVSALEWALLSVVFFLPLWPVYAVIKVGALPGMNLQRALIIVLLGLWVLALIFGRKNADFLFRRIVRHWVPVSLFAVLMFWKFLSVTRSDEPFRSAYLATYEFVVYFLVFLAALTVWRTPRQIRRALLVLVAGSVLVSLVGVYESFVEYNIFASFVPISSEFTQIALDPKIRGEYRVQSTFEHPLALAEYLLFIVPLAAFTAMRSRAALWRVVGALAVLLGVFVVWETGSRSPLAIMIMLVIAYAVYKVLSVKRTPISVGLTLVFLPLVFAAIVVGFGAVSGLAGGRTAEEAGSTQVRTKQLDDGLPLVADEPLLGYGPGRSGAEIGISTPEGVFTVDNYYLTLVLESGVPALALFVLLLGFFIWKAMRLGWGRPGFLHGFAGAMSLALVGFAIFLSVLSLIQVFPLIFIAFALLLCVADVSAAKGASR